MKNKGNNRHSPEFALLGFLYRNANHGYELHRQLKDEFGNIWHASQSQTYNILKRLEAQGYVSITQVEQEKLPPRQLLNLTKTGEELFLAWLNHPTNSSVHAIRVEFLTRLYFMERFFPENTQAMIREQLEMVNNGLEVLGATLASVPAEQSFDRLALELRINLLESVIDWLHQCQSKFASEDLVE